MERITFFNQNYLCKVWIVGLLFALFLLINFLIEKHKYNKFDKKKQLEKIQNIEKLRQLKIDKNK